MNWAKRGRVHEGSMVKHLMSCACPLCDPGGTKVKAQRERFIAEQKARAAAGGASPPAPTRAPRPERLRTPPTNDTRRLIELRREGKTIAQAIEIIEAEHAQRRDHG